MKSSETPYPYVTASSEMKLPAPALIELMRAALERGKAARFQASGESMSPFICDGDVITIEPLARAPFLGEVVAFVSADGARLVVHRVVARRVAASFIRGDNLDGEPDGWVDRENILGRVTRVERAGRTIRFGLGPERVLIAWMSRLGWLDLLRRCALVQRVWRRARN